MAHNQDAISLSIWKILLRLGRNTGAKMYVFVLTDSNVFDYDYRMQVLRYMVVAFTDSNVVDYVCRIEVLR